MGQPAAKANDQVMATDTHIVMVPAGPSLVPTPLPHPFTGQINHPGWRVKELKLATPPEGADEFVLQPAEVQIA